MARTLSCRDALRIAACAGLLPSTRLALGGTPLKKVRVGGLGTVCEARPRGPERKAIGVPDPSMDVAALARASVVRLKGVK